MAFSLLPYIKNKTLRHKYYDATVEHHTEVLVHSDGIYPKKLIEERRPGESKTIHKFRKKIYQCKTKSPFNKVLTSLSKIRASQDYVISFGDQLPPKIAKDETPEKYFTEMFPRYTSLDNWFWTVCFKQMMVDANAVSLTLPINFVKDDTEYYKPYPVIFNSEQIIDYSYKEWYLLRSGESYTFMSGNMKYPGKVYYYADGQVIMKFEQVTLDEKYKVTEYPNPLGYVPVVHLHGVLCEDSGANVKYESRMAPVLPEFNEAVREYSDMQAEVLQHIHSSMWAIEGSECRICKGTGQVPTDDGSIQSCTACGGKGKYPFNPYEYFSVSTGRPGEPQVPTPPAGYIQKSIDIAKLQDARIEDHIYYGLSAINYEFITRSPLAQSGIAKEFDKSETNNFVYSVAEDAVRLLDEHYRIGIDWRYWYLVPDEQKRKELAPEIPVPQKFDVIPDNYLSEEIGKLKTSKVSASIVAAAEVEYAGKKFYQDAEVRDRVVAEFELDPLSGNSEDDINMWKANDGISDIDYVIHCNIRAFIQRAVNEDAGFMAKKQMDKMEVIRGYAEEFLKDNQPVQINLQDNNFGQPPVDNGAVDNGAAAGQTTP